MKKVSETNDMNVWLKSYFLVTLIALATSCDSSVESDNIGKNLPGTWVLDSVSTPSGKLYTATTTGIFKLKENSEYSYEWQSGDVGGNETGRYMVYYNPKRAPMTITFIPNIEVSHHDTIRKRYISFDIIKLTSNRLHTADQTEFIERKGLPAIIFNRHCIYKRAKSL